MGSAEGGESECEGALPPSAGRVWSEELPGMHPGLQACHRDRLSEQGCESLAQAGQKEDDKMSKGLFANMCKALGKGPIPEPGKSKAPEYDSEDDGDDSMLPAFNEEAGKEDVPKSTEGEEC